MKALASVVGAAESDSIGRVPELSAIGLAAQASRNALSDAELTIHDIDGVACAELSPIDLADVLGITPSWVDGTSVGGCSFLTHVRHASAAIAAGQASTVLIAHGESGRSGVGQPPWGRTPGGLTDQFHSPYGTLGPVTTFTVGAMRYLHQYDLPMEAFAHVAVAQRAWAQKTPRARRQEPLTIDDVMASPLVVYPFHRPECCLVTDGGGAIVVVSAERADDFPRPTVDVIGTGEAYDSPTVAGLLDTTSAPVFARSSASALIEAQLNLSDVNHLMVYDAFAHLPVFGLEAIGVVKPGEGVDFVAEGNTSPGGVLPMNTNGGGLSYTHTGMYGMFAIQEAVRQLRGEAAAQIDGVSNSLVQGVGGGTFTAGSCLVFSNVR